MAFERSDNETIGRPEHGQSAGDDSDAPVELDDRPAGERSPYGSPAGDIRADNVTLTQGGARTIEATTVSITQGGASRVRAGQLTVSQGGVVVARTESLTVNEGGSSLVVMTDEATVNEGAKVLLLLSRSVRGEVRPVLDWRAAGAFGAAFAVVLRIMRRR